MEMLYENLTPNLRAGMTLALPFLLLGVVVKAQYVDEYSFLLNDISVENILSNMEALSNFGIRYVLSEKCNKSANFIYKYFSAIAGYKVSSYPFQLPTPLHWSLNVIAEREGSNLKNETVIIFAHYDSVSDVSRTSAPGANDNAAGVAVLMEAARVLGTHELNRTLLFIAFSAEEVGLVGSEAWVSENREFMRSVVGAICLDGVGRGGTIGVFYNRKKSGVLAAYMEGTALGLNFSRFYKERSAQVVLGSDSGPFDEADVRVTRLWDFDTEYIHTPQDTPDTLYADCIGDVAALITVVTYELSTKPLQEVFLPEEETRHNNYSFILYVLAVSICISSGFTLLLRSRRRMSETQTVRPKHGHLACPLKVFLFVFMSCEENIITPFFSALTRLVHIGSIERLRSFVAVFQTQDCSICLLRTIVNLLSRKKSSVKCKLHPGRLALSSPLFWCTSVLAISFRFWCISS